MVKNLPASAGDIRGRGSVPESGRSPGGRHSNPLQYSCLENSTDSRVHGVAKSWTQLSDFTSTLDEPSSSTPKEGLLPSKAPRMLR